MATDLPIRCSCGSVRGVAHGVSRDRGNRVICYCDDCQAFAHFLGQADEILDAQGGTDIFQMSSAHLKILRGSNHIACMRITPKGLLRWYAHCCRTPIGNTLPTYHVPFVGLIHSCMDRAEAGSSLDTILGPVRGRVHARFAKGSLAGVTVHQRVPLAMLLRVGRMFLIARLRGDHKTSPFFDPQTHEPSVAAHVLSEEELYEVRGHNT